MLIWIFQTGEPLHLDGADVRPMRAINLSNALVAAGHDVVLWSSDFFHQKKCHRFSKTKVIQYSNSLEIRLIKSRGYKRNVGFERLIDHAQLAWNLKKWLKNETQIPDVAFIGYPPIESAAVLSKWLCERNVPCLLDVKDQWPSIFVEALPSSLQFFGRFLFWPYFYFGKRAMRDVSGFSTMSIGFQKWVRSFSGKSNLNVDSVFPLTTEQPTVNKRDLELAFNWWAGQGVVSDGGVKLCFVGSLSRAFDFAPVILAASESIKRNDGVQYILCGDGEQFLKLREAASGLSNVVIPGWVDRPKAVALFLMSTAAMAPYKCTQDFTMSVPNKILDYLSFGLPILSPLTGDVERLLVENNSGFPPYGHHGSEELFHQIEKIINDRSLLEKMSQSAKNCHEKQFSFNKVYGGLVTHLERLASKTL